MNVTRRRRTYSGTNDPTTGMPNFTWTTSTVTALAFAPQVSAERDGVDQILSTDTGTLYFRGGTPDVQPEDEYIVRGITYRVVGRESDWHSPFSEWHAGWTVLLERQEHVNG